MQTFATLHRWWGVAFCLLFAMWFASGIVMHLVPFPARTEAAAPDTTGGGTQMVDYDQWTVAGDFDRDRPLTRIEIADAMGTVIYLSSRSGRVVLTTTRNQRLANYVGSIPHWLYQTELRHHKRIWSAVMWWLSLFGTLGAMAGVTLGVVRLATGTADRGLQRWHRTFGLVFAPFVLSWIFSGFLSMQGSLFADQLFRVLHRLDFWPLNAHPWLRTGAILTLCLCGLAFSLSGVVLAWRRVTMRASS